MIEASGIQPVTQLIDNTGRILKAELPQRWKPRDEEVDAMASTDRRAYVNEVDDDIELLFLIRGQTLDPGSAAKLKTLLGRKAVVQLSTSDIIDMQLVMGYEQAGNNQYTNPGGNVFDLTEASVIQASAKPVLFVRGSFKRGKHYAGVLFNENNGFDHVQEIMLQSSTSTSVDRHLPALHHVLDRIVWREE